MRKYSGRNAGLNEGNAQKVYQELNATMTQSVAARTLRAELEKEIHSIRLDGSWNKGVVDF